MVWCLVKHKDNLTFLVYPAPYARGRGAVSFGIKLPGLEADHSPPFTVEVKE
jgi:hypothetical protein